LSNPTDELRGLGRSWDVNGQPRPLDEEIESIEARPGGDVIAYGGAGFARALIRGGLVDEYRLNVHPAALGAGLPIFTELPRPLERELV
jgi:dihydrofolate reductase